MFTLLNVSNLRLQSVKKQVNTWVILLAPLSRNSLPNAKICKSDLCDEEANSNNSSHDIVEFVQNALLTPKRCCDVLFLLDKGAGLSWDLFSYTQRAQASPRKKKKWREEEIEMWWSSVVHRG